MEGIEEEVGEGKNLQLLRVTFRKMIEDAVGSFPEQEFVKQLSFSKLSKKKIVQLMEVFKKTIVKGVTDEFERVVSSECMDQLLKERDILLHEQADFDGTIAWRPSGSVTEDVRSHDMVIYKTKAEQLTVMCDRAESHLSALKDEVLESRRKSYLNQKKLSEVSEMLDEIIVNVSNKKEGNVKMADSLNGPGS